MRQALHIFRKDVRGLWPEISIAAAAAAAFTFMAARGTEGVAPAVLTYLLPAAWGFLIARVVQAEALPGDRQFWVTRPYDWRSLLAAKALFIAAFVNLPKLIGDAAILRAYGFEIGPEVDGLLWTQVLLTAAFVAPLAALSALTTGIVPLIGVVLVLVLAAAGASGAPWLALEWTRSYSAGLLVAVAAAAIVVRQYRRRDTATSRVVAGCAGAAALAALAWMPWQAGFALQSRFSSQRIDDSAVRAVFEPETGWTARAFVHKDGFVEIEIPLSITGIPESLKPKADGVAARIEGPDGLVWRAEGQPWRHVQHRGERASFRARVESSFYEKVKNTPVRIHGSIFLTLYGNARTAMLPIGDRGRFTPAPGAGLCSAARSDRGIVLTCRSTARQWRDSVAFDVMGQAVLGSAPGPPASLHTLFPPRPVSYSPFRGDLQSHPVAQTMQVAPVFPQWRPFTGVRVRALEPVAHVRREWEVNGLRLADYEAP